MHGEYPKWPTRATSTTVRLTWQMIERDLLIDFVSTIHNFVIDIVSANNPFNDGALLQRFVAVCVDAYVHVMAATTYAQLAFFVFPAGFSFAPFLPYICACNHRET
jgi:hypothetical protein